MPDEPLKDSSNVLLYAAPATDRNERQPFRAVVVAIIASLFALAGTGCLFGGICGMIFDLPHSNPRNVRSDAIVLSVFILIGLISLAAAVRWLREVRPIASGRRTKKISNATKSY